MDEGDPFDEYAVVMNDEDQHSIWPTCKPMPRGWRSTGHQGTKAECLEHIDRSWVDMRPRSVATR